MVPLGKYEDQVVILQLLGAKIISQIEWLAVRVREFGFGICINVYKELIS